ncbi:MAG: hypothetical protein LBF74_05665 [Treponema sp.]|jgi:hypothetical protein|nr:hypothetical protein [Treponema sp.]
MTGREQAAYRRWLEFAVWQTERELLKARNEYLRGSETAARAVRRLETQLSGLQRERCAQNG